MEEPTGHIWVVIVVAVFACSTIFTVALQAALAALVQVRGHIDAGAVLEEGLTGLLQTTHLVLVFKYGLAHCRREVCVNDILSLFTTNKKEGTRLTFERLVTRTAFSGSLDFCFLQHCPILGRVKWSSWDLAFLGDLLILTQVREVAVAAGVGVTF